MQDEAPAPSKMASLVVVYVTVFVDLLGFGMILPLLPFYAMHFGASGLWIGILATAYSAAQFAGAPVVGWLSDRFGRRPVLLAALAGSAVSLALAGFATSLTMLIVARALAGLFGGSIAAAQAYVADVTAPGERSRYMGMLGASIGMGFVFGPALGAGLSVFGFGTAALAASGIAFANLIGAYFLLVESRHGGSTTSRRASLWVGIIQSIKAGHLRLLLIGSFLITFAFVGMETTYALLSAKRFDLSAQGLGYVFTYIGVVIVVVQGGLIGRMVKRLGEQRVAMLGAVIMMMGLTLIPLAPSLAWSVAALSLLAAGQAFTSPTIATMLSKCAGVDEQGEVLGLSQSLAAAARGLMPVIAGGLFDLGAALPYILSATVSLIAAILIGLVPVDEGSTKWRGAKHYGN
ncbi:MAG: MFS transporter [Deltaproteobacteria bacterium]|nr:MFS transporter [Deltaproteobacteria bacterium]